MDKLPDVSVLEGVNPTAEENVQPGWIRERHPDYVEHHMMHRPLTSVRTFTHANHHVKITTTYQIEIDGISVQLHALVDDQGRLVSHTTPFVSYGGAPDLVKALIDRFPESFANLGNGGEGDDHRHGEGGA